MVDLGTAAMFSRGQEGVNLVAAVPSLHSAFVALVAFFLWGRVRPWMRPLLLLYPLAMGLTLIATGEHYFFDVALGWLYAGAVMAGWGWWERRRGDERPQDCVRADLSLSIASTGSGSTPRAAASRRETRSPSITAEKSRAVRVSPTV